MLSSRGWVGPHLHPDPTQGAQSQQHSLCPALSRHQMGQGEPTVCLGGEWMLLLDRIPVWGAGGAEAHTSLGPSPSILLQNAASCLCTARVSPGNVCLVGAYHPPREDLSKIHTHQFSNFSSKTSFVLDIFYGHCQIGSPWA